MAYVEILGYIHRKHVKREPLTRQGTPREAVSL